MILLIMLGFFNIIPIGTSVMCATGVLVVYNTIIIIEQIKLKKYFAAGAYISLAIILLIIVLINIYDPQTML